MRRGYIYSYVSFIIGIFLITASFIFTDEVSLYGEKYKKNIASVDLSNFPINANELDIKLENFNKLEHVKLKDGSITLEDKKNLERRYPNIVFDVDSVVNIYGIPFRESDTSLDLQNVKVDEHLEEYLGYFRNLESVNLLNQELDTSTQLKLLNTYKNTKFIWNVKILDKYVDSSIDKLDLTYSTVNDTTELINSIRLLNNLQYIDMSFCNLSNEELANLRDIFPNIKVVWTVKFGVWKLRTDAVSFSVLISNFPYVRLKSSDLEVLKYCTELQALDLGHQAITDISVIVDACPNLRVLILADNKISDISPISKLKHLHYLELFMNKITDISPLIECKELVDLNIAHIYTLSNISPLLNNDFPMLERIWVTASPIPYNDVQALKNKYPQAKVSTTGVGSTSDGWRTHPRYYAMINMYYDRTYISDLFTKYG